MLNCESVGGCNIVDGVCVRQGAAHVPESSRLRAEGERAHQMQSLGRRLAYADMINGVTDPRRALSGVVGICARAEVEFRALVESSTPRSED